MNTERAEKKPQKQTEKAKEAASATNEIIFSSSRSMEDLLDAEQDKQAEWSSSNLSIKFQSDSEREEHGESSESEEDQANLDTKDASFFRSGKEEEGQ